MLPDKYVEKRVYRFEIILYRAVFNVFIELIVYLQLVEIYLFYFYCDSLLYIFYAVLLCQLKYFLVHIWEVS